MGLTSIKIPYGCSCRIGNITLSTLHEDIGTSMTNMSFYHTHLSLPSENVTITDIKTYSLNLTYQTNLNIKHERYNLSDDDIAYKSSGMAIESFTKLLNHDNDTWTKLQESIKSDVPNPWYENKFAIPFPGISQLIILPFSIKAFVWFIIILDIGLVVYVMTKHVGGGIILPMSSHVFKQIPTKDDTYVQAYPPPGFCYGSG